MQPSTIDTEALLDLLTRHQVVEPEPLWQFLAARGGAAGLDPDASEVVADLIRAGLLSEFQAEHLLANDVDALAVGKYQLLDRIGGLGSSVFRARLRRASSISLSPVRAGGPVALKILGRDQDIPRTVVERFRREAQALAVLDHPGIVGIKDSGEDQGRLFLVMEHIDGVSLDEMVQRQGPLLPAMAVRLIHQALDALAHIHEAGLVHRNLEPGHIMLDQDGKARIVDLGVARFLDDPAANLTMLNGHSQFLGTVEYQSPEQLVNSHDVDIRTDIYALGAILYFLLTGKPPFCTHALLRLASGVVTHPQPLGQLRPDLPRELVGVVETMMACDRTQRYAAPRSASAALEAWLIQVSPPPLRVPIRRSAQGVQRPSTQGVERLGLPPSEGRSAQSTVSETISQTSEQPANAPGWLVALLVFLGSAAVALWVLALLRGQ